jgi:nucleotide-binding universal stress UspA family protein
MEASMYKRILLAYDGSDEGHKALFECGELAVLLNAKVDLLAVIPSYAGIMVAEGMIIEDNYDQERQRYQAVLEEGLSSLRSRGYSVEGQVAHGEPVDEICARARELKADLICVGHRHANTWAQRWWRGSLGKNLIDHAPCSVLIAMAP